MEKLNWKFILITSLVAVFISILSGLIGGVNAGSVFLRALVVLLIFAGFATVVNFVSVSFLNSGSADDRPEDNTGSGGEGANVNIVLPEDDSALAELASEPEVIDGDGLSTDMYAEVISSENSETDGKNQNLNLMTSSDIDTLPDLASFSTTFTSAVDNEEKKTDSEAESGYTESTSFSSGNKLSAEGLAGTIAEQNSPEDLAKAVKTVLKREETG